MARKSMYDQKILPKLDIIEGWARNGLTLEDIAHNLGISKVTLIKYKKSHKELSDAIDTGKEIADIRVENALYRRAIGFYSKEQKVITVRDPDGETRPEVVEYDVYHKPDVTAQIFWLKNRKPESWRDKVEIETAEGELLPTLTIEEALDESAITPQDDGNLETAAETVSLSEKT